MKRTLDELCGMQGVNGAFLLSEEGQLIEFSAPPIYDREIITQAAASLSRATESMSVQHNDWDTLVAHFEDSKLFILKMEGATLCVLADSNLNLPFLKVAIRVAKRKILKRLAAASTAGMGVSSSFSAYASQFSDTYNSQAPVSAGFPSGSHSIHPHGSYASLSHSTPEQHPGGLGSSFSDNSSLFWSGLGGTGMQSSAVSVADEASSKMLTKISDSLASIVGPMAKVFVKEAVRRICPAEPFDMRHVRHLITELEQQHIVDNDDLQEFRDGIQK
jgi:predicted regulator of Ras-like GTPase activity (Roadblock/LC7/MglB family)